MYEYIYVEEPGGWVVGWSNVILDPTLALIRAQLGFRIQVGAECGNNRELTTSDNLVVILFLFCDCVCIVLCYVVVIMVVRLIVWRSARGKC